MEYNYTLRQKKRKTEKRKKINGKEKYILKAYFTLILM